MKDIITGWVYGLMVGFIVVIGVIVVAVVRSAF